MGSKLRNEDERCSNIVSNFLDEHFYLKKCTNFQRIEDKNNQIKGIDTIFELNGNQYICDEKAAIRYVNKPLKTFSMELSFIDRSGCSHDGWLLDENKINDSFLFVWIDKAKNDILNSIDDIQEIEIALVLKKDILLFLEKLGWNIDKLIRKSELMQDDENENCGDLYKNGCIFVCSRFLYEKPVNVLISRKDLIKLSIFNEKII